MGKQTPERVNELTPEIKNWFGNGESDVDLMLRMGVVKPQFILDLYNHDVLGLELPDYTRIGPPDGRICPICYGDTYDCRGCGRY